MTNFTKALQKDFTDDFYCDNCKAEGTLRIKSIELDLDRRDIEMNPCVDVYCECNECGAEVVERFRLVYDCTEILSTEDEEEGE